jgi:acyl carrier protein
MWLTMSSHARNDLALLVDGGYGKQLAQHETLTQRMVRDRIAVLANEIAGIPLHCMTDWATIDEELQMQSVAFVELQVALEDEYQVELDPIEMVELNRFDAIVAYVYHKALAVRR